MADVLKLFHIVNIIYKLFVMVDSCRQGDPSVQDTAAVSSEGCCDAGAALLHCDVILSWPRVRQCGDDPASSEMRTESAAEIRILTSATMLLRLPQLHETHWPRPGEENRSRGGEEERSTTLRSTMRHCDHTITIDTMLSSELKSTT